MSGRFGDIKGPFLVWLFSTAYMTLYLAVRRWLGFFTTLSIESLLLESAEVYCVLLAFFVLFLVLWEKQRSVRNLFSSVGLKREGIVKSLLWSLALFPAFVAIGLVSMTFASALMSVQSSSALISTNGQFPLWYSYYLIVYAFFPVAVVEEAFARGYMLDRLMPEHPLSLKKALPAILLSSLLFTVWHLPSYLSPFLAGSQVSMLFVAVILGGNVFPISLVLGVAYVRARSRNIVGPVLIHFLLDALPVIVTLV